MATAQCAIKPPQSSQPGPNGVNPKPQPMAAFGVPTPRQQVPQYMCPGMYTTSQDHQPGPSCTSHPQSHIPSHPFFTQPPPPPMPPFLQYQWPMPFFYNPFTGFPAMGYGMVMPPFPPNPYMETPGYMLPHHLQHVNYRRVIHPQFPAASAPYQSQNPNRRFQPQQNVSVVKTVSSEVQTEPVLAGNGYGEGSPLAGSESGHGTYSSTTPPSDSCREKQSHADVENHTSAADVENHTSAADVENHTSAGNNTKEHFLVGKMGPSEKLVPVCSSPDREEEVPAKERRVSFPDILMSWVGGTPPVTTPDSSGGTTPVTAPDSSGGTPPVTTPDSSGGTPPVTAPDSSGGTPPVTAPDSSANVLHKRKEKLPSLEDAELDQEPINSLTETKTDPVFSPKKTKILQLPCTIKDHQLVSNKPNDPVVVVDSIVAHIHSRNGMCQNTLLDSPGRSQEVPERDEPKREDNDDSTLYREATDISQDLCHFQFKRKMNESIWSVESLAPFIPSKEWLMQNELLDPEIIIEELLGSPSPKNGDLMVHSRERRLSRRFSLSTETLPMFFPSASWLSDQQSLNKYNTFPITSPQQADTSTPFEKFNPQKKHEMGTHIQEEEQLKSGQCMDPSQSLAFPSLLGENGGVRERVEHDSKYGSSEPEAIPSPNQECPKVTEQEISPCSSKKVETHLPDPLEEGSPSSSQTSPQIKTIEQELCGKGLTTPATAEQLAVEMTSQKHDTVSPSKGHLVDCAVQCLELQDCPCKRRNKGGNKATSQNSDLGCRHNTATVDEEDCENQHEIFKKHGHKKNRRQPSFKRLVQRNRCKDGQEEAHTAGKAKGGNGRNPRC